MDLGVKVEIFVEVTAEFEVEGEAGGAVLDDGFWAESSVVGGFDLGIADSLFGAVNDVFDLIIDDASDGEVTATFVGEHSEFFTNRFGGVVPDFAAFGEVTFVEEFCFQTVVEVVAIIGNFVGEVGDLCFEGGTVGCEFGFFAGGIVTCLVFG